MNRRVAAVLWILAALAVACMWAAFEMALGATAKAHSDKGMSYDYDCCGDMDCAPVDKVEIVPAAIAAGLGGKPGLPSLMMLTSKHGTVIVPQNYQFRDSKDGRMHVCMRQAYDGSGRMEPICVYLPPTN